MNIRTLLAILLVFAVQSGFSAAQEPDAENLAAMAPRVSLDNELIKSFEVSGVLDTGVKLRFRVLGKQPNHLAMWIMDPIDGTPVMVGIGDKATLYDPLASEMLVAHPIRSAFRLDVQEDHENLDKQGKPTNQLNFGFGVHSLKDEGEDKEDEQATGRIVIDIASIYGFLPRPLELKQELDRYMLSGQTDAGNQVVAVVDPDRKQGAFSRLELYQANSKNPFMVLDEISINQPIQDERFVFPVDRLKKSGIPAKEIKTEKIINGLLSIKRMMMAIMTRMVIIGEGQIGLKRRIEAMSSKPIDWDQVRENDAKYSPALKKIFEDR